MTTTIDRSATYMLGYSAEEQRRLDLQGAILRPTTERLLREAGLEPGMRVLDVGCGTGDVSLLAAGLVGPTGAVVGLDRSAEVLATARDRAEARELRQVSFVQDDVATCALPGPFDAVVGRLILMYQADPVAVVRHLASMVRPGGTLAFLEYAHPAGRPWPERPLFGRAYGWVTAALEVTNAHLDLAMRLPAIFLNAGLSDPRYRLDATIIEGADAAWLGNYAEVIRSVQQTLERYELATPTEIAIDTLLDRLLDEAREAGGAVLGPTLGAAWARTPAVWVVADSGSGVSRIHPIPDELEETS